MSFRTLLFALAASVSAKAAGAQIRVELLPEFRADAIIGKPDALHLGGGLAVPLGLYTRVGVAGGAGASKDGASGRTDLFARFHLDPNHQARYGLYAGGGLSARFDYERETRVYLHGFIGLEGPPRGRWMPAVEAGFGGGVRLALVLRRLTKER
jgi:hypothetical protein